MPSSCTLGYATKDRSVAADSPDASLTSAEIEKRVRRGTDISSACAMRTSPDASGSSVPSSSTW
jgi:hypothetical protein